MPKDDQASSVPNQAQALEATEPPKNVKPPKPEDKPFQEFIREDLLPGLQAALIDRGITPTILKFVEDQRPVVGGKCWMVVGEIPPGRRFWLSFSKEQISSLKTISLAEPGSEPSLLESFLIDEKRSTLVLLISRLLQRLNGQKWLNAN